MCRFILPRFHFQIEKWKYNKEYNIFVSNLGNFKDAKGENLPIKISKSTGYCVVLTKDNGFLCCHRLILKTWKPIKNDKEMTVDHLDHNKRHNAVKNLEWVTETENLLRAKTDEVIDGGKLKLKQHIICGKQSFSTIEAAIDFVISLNSKGSINADRDNIKKKINKAITTKDLYCGRYWKIKTIY